MVNLTYYHDNSSDPFNEHCFWLDLYMKVRFNKPFLPAVNWGKEFGKNEVLQTQGRYYESCRTFLREKFGFKRNILTPSCTAALEIIALALDIKPGDEIILPSYTFVSTANAFALRGAKLIFSDTLPNHPSLDLKQAEKLIGPRTKAMVVVHYGGLAMDYNHLARIKKKYRICIIEDAAHCLGATYQGKIIGSIGDFATFSFHETKNITCGMGGALIVNNETYWHRVNQISQCGTNKLDFIKGKVKYYSWQTVGSNYLLAEPLCLILLKGLSAIHKVSSRRITLALRYHNQLSPLVKSGLIELAPLDRHGNGHIFYITVKDLKIRDRLLSELRNNGIEATFHYSSLHQSDFFKNQHSGPSELIHTDKFSSTLVRLPLHYYLTKKEQDEVIKSLYSFFKQ